MQRKTKQKSFLLSLGYGIFTGVPVNKRIHLTAFQQLHDCLKITETLPKIAEKHSTICVSKTSKIRSLPYYCICDLEHFRKYPVTALSKRRAFSSAIYELSSELAAT